MDSGEALELKREVADKLEYGKARRPEFGPIWLDIHTKTLNRAGMNKAEKLTNHEYQILWLLIRAQGKNISMSEMTEFIMENKPENEDIPLSNVCQVQLTNIRKKLKDFAGDKVKLVTSLHGTHEYRLELA